MNNTRTGAMSLQHKLLLFFLVVFGAVLLQPIFAKGGASASCPSDMVSLWKLEEGNDVTTFVDEIGSNDGAVLGTRTTRVDGRVGSAQAFAAGQGITIPADASLNWDVDDEFTIEFWMKSDGADTNQVVLGRNNPAAASIDGSQLWIGTGGTRMAKMYFRFADRTKTASIDGNTALNNGQWHHLVLVREMDGSLPQSEFRLYVDGAQQGSKVVSHDGQALNLSSEPIILGSLAGGSQYVGELDELAIYDGVLSDALIQAHYTNGLAGIGYCEEAGDGVTITSTPPTTASIDGEYTYQVTASGDPAPTFSLVQAPDGMAIDESTGLITWTPDAAGTFGVQVRAANDQDSDTQSFDIQVAENQAPTANAGEDRSVPEGMGVILDGTGSEDADGEIASYGWTQVLGPEVVLSDPAAPSPTFVAPLVNGESVELAFELTVTDNRGLTASDTVTITVEENNIIGFDEDVIAFMTYDQSKAMAVRAEGNSTLVYLAPVDPDDISDNRRRPTSLEYGLVDFTVKVENPGDTAEVTFFLPEAAPEDYSWIKYSEANGWENYDEHVVFNEERTAVTLTLQDGGFGDADGVANGMITDPSGPGVPGTSGSGGSSSGGCSLTPQGALGLEWLLLLMGPALIRLSLRMKRR
jgi:hypothetical protein